MAITLALTPAFAVSKGNDSGQGKAVVTILPQKGKEMLAPVPVEDLQLKVGGKDSSVTGWTPLADAANRIEVVLLIDAGAQTSLGTQFSSIQDFIQKLPQGAAVAVAYMANGRALLAGPLTTDHTAALRGLRLPAGGSPGISASPYFCLSDLAKNWPSKDRQARREVVMITDGVDYYEEIYNPDDPYVLAAISDALRSNLVVYSMYWGSRGGMDSTVYAASTGQNLLEEVSEATGGMSYWMGLGNPVSLEPYFNDVALRMAHQYALEYVTDLKGGPGVENLKLQVKQTAGKVAAPTQTYVQRKQESKQ
jgi:hypothetical protein